VLHFIKGEFCLLFFGLKINKRKGLSNPKERRENNVERTLKLK